VLTVYETWPVENDPDNGPMSPPVKGMWVWWRTGVHPMGRWQAMECSGKEFGNAYSENQKRFPVYQDHAHGSAGDWGNFSCHACRYFSDGYPEPNHRTQCDGICRVPDCTMHGEEEL
jgi:hypothetical protein